MRTDLRTECFYVPGFPGALLPDPLRSLLFTVTLGGRCSYPCWQTGRLRCQEMEKLSQVSPLVRVQLPSDISILMKHFSLFLCLPLVTAHFLHFSGKEDWKNFFLNWALAPNAF